MSFNTVWLEKAESRQAMIGLTQPSAQLHFIGKNPLAADDDTDANLSLLATIPLLYPGYFYAALGFRSYEIKPLGGGAYEASATYIRQDSLYVFDTGGGTQKITQAIAQLGVYGPSGATQGVAALVTSGSVDALLVGGDTTAGLSAGMVLTSDAQNAFPSGTVINTVTDATHLALSVAASKTTGRPTSLVCSIMNGSVNVSVTLATVTVPAEITLGSTTVLATGPDAALTFNVGANVAGPGIAPGTTVVGIPDIQHFVISNAATASGNVSLVIDSNKDTSQLAVGMSVQGNGIAPGTTVASIVDATHFTLSANATTTFALLTLSFSETEYLFFGPATLLGKPPDFKGAINVKDDSVEGVEVEIPAGHFELTIYVLPEAVTQEYQLLCEYMTGSVNSDVFNGRQPGEVKFLGMRGSQKGQDVTELTYRFAVSPNRANFQVANIPVASKRGWDYLWVRYKKFADPGANVILDVPAWVVVNQVFPMVPFSQLRLS